MISLPYPPSLNRYLRHTGRTYKTAEAIAYSKHAARAATLAGVKCIDSDVAVDIVLHPRTTKAGKASGTLIDLDNALKVALDALNGIAYLDDKQVKRLTAAVGAPVPGGGLSVRVFLMPPTAGMPALRNLAPQPLGGTQTGQDKRQDNSEHHLDHQRLTKSP